jgi:hypothetical protein
MRFVRFANPSGVRWHIEQLVANNRWPDFPESKSWARIGPAVSQHNDAE